MITHNTKIQGEFLVADNSPKVSFNYQGYDFELFADDKEVEIYCGQTDFSGFTARHFGIMEVEVPMGPTFSVWQTCKKPLEWCVSVNTTRRIV